MRKGVDYIGVTVCFYCYDGKGHLLLQKRSQNCRDEQGRWDCGGGSMKVGETFEQAVLRELEEECDIHPKKLTFCGVNNVLRKNGNENTHWVALIYAALVDPQEVKIIDTDKIDDIGWFKPENFPQPLHSMYLEHLEFVKKCIKI